MAKKWGEAGNTFSSIANHHVKVIFDFDLYAERGIF